MIRLRITFSKTGSLRYTGHLDLQTVWERTARRAGLPLAYTQGFHPGPRIQIASALPLGFIGHAEIVDIWLNEPGPVGTDTGPFVVQAARPYARLLQPAAPPGLTILSAEQVDEHGPALQTQVASAEYVATLLDPDSGSDLEQRLKDLLATGSIPRERRGKPYDLRPLIESLSFSPPPMGEGPGVRVFMRLSAREAATGRPDEVLAVLGIPFEATRIERLRIILKMD
jgi:radical SAM-linked protein